MMAEIESWLREILVSVNMDDYKITSNANAKDGGYMSDMIMVNLKHSTDTENNQSYNLVIKKGSSYKEVREAMDLGEAYSNEILIYTTIFPLFQKFQLHRDISDVFDAFPKCYGYKFFDDFEIIVLENIKEAGYRLHDRKQCMNLDHCKLVLRQYAKFHAISFAFKDQNSVSFKTLAEQLHNVLHQMVASNPNSMDLMKSNVDTIRKTLIENNDTELAKKYGEEMKNLIELSLCLLNDRNEQSVIVHGDNWNNNYMFQYKDNNPAFPTAVAILDWQMANVHSPVYDVANFLFNVCSKKEFLHIENLLKYYHNHLSNFMIKLGSNPEELFSLSDFKKHWRKYSLYGLIGNAMNIKMAVLEEDEAPYTEQLAEGKGIDELFNIHLKTTELFQRRVKDCIESYFQIKENEHFLD